MASPYLLVGLGNPGPKYAGNRHNIGFRVIDALAEGAAFREKFRGHTAKGQVGGEDAVFLKPMTFMNLSGESVRPAMQFYKVPLERVVVVHDELDLEEGTLRLKLGGGTAGHNGLKSMVQHCGGNGFIRLRYGIGRPRGGPTASYVLSDFSADERISLSDNIERATKIIADVLRLGVSDAMNRHNRR
ncbi:MAG: aminoacyl-tRNA hydrolase [Myxococcota bacterium]